MNNHWGFCNFDYQYKPADMLVRKLVECVSKGGNMILNVGPGRKREYPGAKCGNLKRNRPLDEEKRREHLWMYPCTLPKPEWGRYTQKGNTIYAHVYEAPLGALPLYG